MCSVSVSIWSVCPVFLICFVCVSGLSWTGTDHLKKEWQLTEERLILEEMLEVVEQRDSLVSLLKEQRLHERQEDQDLDEVMMAQGLELHWS